MYLKGSALSLDVNPSPATGTIFYRCKCYWFVSKGIKNFGTQSSVVTTGSSGRFGRGSHHSFFLFLRPHQVGSPTLHSRGCVAATSCGTTVTGTIIGVEYTSKYACCTTDLCNGASAVQLSLTAGLCAAILSSLWGFI
uniref:Uncharacterized protein n=1 Tax=Poecilia mexicana TaxID=48701 RepID=A0A3B3WN22_9TELE